MMIMKMMMMMIIIIRRRRRRRKKERKKERMVASWIPLKFPHFQSSLPNALAAVLVWNYEPALLYR
jgi:hypothetical protein